MKTLLLLSSLLLFTSCTSDSSSDIPEFDLQGHRGTRAYAPENTIPSFKLALDMGSNTLELDLVVSKDSQLVVSHEPWFNPLFTTKPDGTPLDTSETKLFNFLKMDYSEIAKFDVGTRSNPNYPEQKSIPAIKPTFAEMVKEIDAYTAEKGMPKSRFTIELKGYANKTPNAKFFAKLVHEQIAALGIEKRSTVQSFEMQLIREVHALNPNQRIALLTGGNPDLLTAVSKLGFKPAVLSPHYDALSDSLVQVLHEENFKVVPWTVNSIDAIEKMLSYKVDGIITDYPDRVKAILSAK